MIYADDVQAPMRHTPPPPGVLVAMDEGKITAVVLLDLSSAFDTVDHDNFLSWSSNSVIFALLALYLTGASLTSQEEPKQFVLVRPLHAQ